MGLSKEEKKAKKAAQLLDKIRQQNELLKKIKLMELDREIAAQKRKRDELDKNWRETMLKIKEPVFRQDVEVMWRVFERLYDRKDYIISHTFKLLNVADDQFQRTFASFCEIFDGMINKFLNELEELSEKNDHLTKEILQRGEDEANFIMDNHNAAETHLQLMIYHSHETNDNILWTKRGENLVKLDEDRNTYTDVRDNLKSLLENKYNNTWEEYKAVLKAYVLDTAENQKHVRVLRKKENIMADIIASQAKKIANSDGLLKRLRNELAAYESGTKQIAFRDRRNRHRDACDRIKKNLYDGVTKDQNRLALLVKVTTDAESWLKCCYQKVDKILRLAALCRKFETCKEKVLPFDTYKPHSPVVIDRITRNHESSNAKLVMEAINTTRGFTRLWHRISKAELIKRSLHREKQLLQEENYYMLSQIEGYDDKEQQTDECLCTNSKLIHGTHSQNTSKVVAVDGRMEASKYDLSSKIFKP